MLKNLMLFAQRKNMLGLLYAPDFKEKLIPTKSRLVRMKQELMEHYKAKIRDLLDKRLNRQPWSCLAFYVMLKWKDEFKDL